MKCIICNEIITRQNDSVEHIIPNSIGGNLTVKGFLCCSCNNVTGEQWDAELASQLNGYCLFFEIKRERGFIPSQIVRTTAGETYEMCASGELRLPKPVVNKANENGKVQYKIVARSLSEARGIVHNIKKKFPNCNIETTLDKVEPEAFYPDGMIQIPSQIGGHKAGRSIVKSAVAFMHYIAMSAEICDQALLYLQDQNASACFGYYWTSDLIVNRPTGVPLHCVAISGDPTNGMLLGYVEYFGIFRTVILLSETYAGPCVEKCHAIDPRTSEQLDLTVRLSFSKADMIDIFEYKHCAAKDVEQAARAVLGPAMAHRQEKAKSRAIKDAIQYALRNCGAQPGDILTEEQKRIVAQLISEKLAQFYINLIRPRYVPQPTNLGSDMSSK